MKLNGKGLVGFLERAQKTKKQAFPGNGSTNYYDRFRGIEDYLNAKVHPHVNTSADAIDGGMLTDHGPDHIKTVILRAGKLASNMCDLSPYEVYLLLVAAHFHDVGNLFGRDTHEINTEEVMKKLGLLLGEDTVEQKAIIRYRTSAWREHQWGQR